MASSVLPVIVGLSFFMQWFDTGACHTVLPVMAREFAMNPVRLSSVTLAFMLGMIVLMPISGWLAQTLGIRRLVGLSVILFVAGALLCAASFSFVTLVSGRLIQGFAAAFLLPAGRLAILRTADDKRRTQLLSFIAVPGLVGLFFGPMAAGFAASFSSWRLVFLFHLLPAGLILFWGLKSYPADRAAEKPPLDVAGFLLLAGSVMAAVLALEGKIELLWPAGLAFSAAALSVLLFLAYVWHAKRAAHPLIDLSVFSQRSFSVGLAGNLVNGITGGAVPFLVPMLLQVVFHLDAATTGMVMACGAVGSIMAKNIVPYLIEKIGYRLFLAVNTVVLSGIILLFMGVDANTPAVLMMVLMGLFSGVNSFQFTATFTLALSEVDAGRAASGNTAVSVATQFFAGISVGVATLLLGFFAPDATLSSSAFSSTFLCVALANATVLVFLLWLPGGPGKRLSGKKGSEPIVGTIH